MRHQMQRAVDDNVAISLNATAYIVDQLASVQLHVGLPASVRRSAAYVNEYFGELLVSKINFLDHLESRWTFAKRKMEEMLTGGGGGNDGQQHSTRHTQQMVASLYPPLGTERRSGLAEYSAELHAVVVAERAVHQPYFHHKYPM